jgi:hypothetical protein
MTPAMRGQNCTHSTLAKRQRAGRMERRTTRDYSPGMHAMENKGWWWQYLFRKTIPRRLKWNLKLSVPQSGVKTPPRKKKEKREGANEKNDDCYTITGKRERRKCNGRLKKESQYNWNSHTHTYATPCLIFYFFCLLFVINTGRRKGTFLQRNFSTDVFLQENFIFTKYNCDIYKAIQ